MGSRDYLDLDETPEAVASTTATLAENAAVPGAGAEGDARTRAS